MIYRADDPALRQLFPRLPGTETVRPPDEIDNLFWSDTTKNPTPGAIVPCLLCKKPMVMPKYYGHAPDQICPSCENEYRELAKLVCGRCNVTIARIIPGTVPDSGYEIRQREVLHTDTCGVCAPNKRISYVKEIVEWVKTRRPMKAIVCMKSIPDADLKTNPYKDIKPDVWESIKIVPPRRRKPEGESSA